MFAVGQEAACVSECAVSLFMIISPPPLKLHLYLPFYTRLEKGGIFGWR